MFDQQETPICLTSLICLVPVPLITLVNSTNKDQLFWWPCTVRKCIFII